jgi:membrane protein YdbS with pleckstrin-like domain
MTLKNQTASYTGIFWLLALVAVVLPVAGGIYGYNPWWMLLAGIVALIVVALLSTLPDAMRYIRMRSM